MRRPIASPEVVATAQHKVTGVCTTTTTEVSECPDLRESRLLEVGVKAT